MACTAEIKRKSGLIAVPRKEVGEKMTASLGPSSEAESARAMQRGSEVGVAMLTILKAFPG